MAEEKARITIWVNGKEVENSLKGISAEMRKTRSELRNLTIGTKEYNETAQRLQSLDKIYTQQTQAVRGLSRESTFLSKAGGEVKASFMDLISPATLVAGGIAAVGAGLMSGVNVIRETDSALRDLQAITGVTEQSLDFFRESAVNMSAAFGETPAAILEAFKLAGSAKPELLESGEAMTEFTKQALTLAKASRMDVADAISSLTTIMNANGASAEDASRYINVLAAGAQKGAKEVDFLAEAFQNLGAIGKTSGLSIEEQTALLETLGEKGFNSASVAGTNLKGVILTLLEDTRNLTEGKLDLNKVFQNYNAIAGDAAELTNIFGRENVAAAQAVLMSSERVNQLTAEVTGTNSANEQAAIQMQLLDERLARVGTSWDRMWASWAGGESIIGWFIDSISASFDAMSSLSTMISHFTGRGSSSKPAGNDWKAEAKARNSADAQNILNQQNGEKALKEHIDLRKQALAEVNKESQEYQWIQQEIIDKNNVLYAKEQERIKQEQSQKEHKEKELELAKNLQKAEEARVKAAQNKVKADQAQSVSANASEGITSMGASGIDPELMRTQQLEDAKAQIVMNSEASIQQFKEAMQEASFESEIQKAMEKEEALKSMRLSILGTLGNTANAFLQRSADRRSEKERKSLEQQKERGLLSEEQYQKKMEGIEREAFKRKKRVDIASAFINGAVAATKAAAFLGGPINPAYWPTMAAIAVETGAQVAFIATQKFREGGMVYGPSHERGGVKAEMEGGEFVIRKDSVNPMTLPVLEAINKGKIKYMNLPAAVNNTRADNGGSVRSNVAASSGDYATRSELIAALSAIDDWNKQFKVVMPLRDLQEAEDRKKRVETLSRVA